MSYNEITQKSNWAKKKIRIYISRINSDLHIDASNILSGQSKDIDRIKDIYIWYLVWPRKSV